MLQHLLPLDPRPWGATLPTKMKISPCICSRTEHRLSFELILELTRQSEHLGLNLNTQANLTLTQCIQEPNQSISDHHGQPQYVLEHSLGNMVSLHLCSLSLHKHLAEFYQCSVRFFDYRWDIWWHWYRNEHIGAATTRVFLYSESLLATSIHATQLSAKQ